MADIKVITESDAAEDISFADVWTQINSLYKKDKVHAVRSQELIKTLHHKIAVDFYRRLSKRAKNNGVKVVEEAPIYGSYKKKDVDIAVIDPYNGPLLTIGVRSQMSSVGKNVLTYYQDIIGECISLQERFPMTVMGYVYLHPLKYFDKEVEKTTDVARYSRLYSSIASRDDRLYKHQVGSYDHFAYAVVEFDSSTNRPSPNRLRDDMVKTAVDNIDLSVSTFVDRMVSTFQRRNIWLDGIFD